MVPSLRTTSPEPFPLDHAKKKHTVLGGGHKSYELSHDMIDGASHSKSRHPSIANLLRKKKLLRKMGPSGNRDGSPPPFLGGSAPRIVRGRDWCPLLLSSYLFYRRPIPSVHQPLSSNHWYPLHLPRPPAEALLRQSVLSFIPRWLLSWTSLRRLNHTLCAV